MKYKMLLPVLILVVSVLLASPALAVTIKPIDDPWDNPDYQEKDGATYYTHNEVGYVVVWETPECSVDGGYMLLNNGTELTVQYRVTYMENVPWGFVSIPSTVVGADPLFEGWILMTDLVDANGEPAYVMPPEIPEHPMIPNPTEMVPPTETVEPTVSPTSEITQPQRPEQAITINNTYNNAIVYTSVGIAVFALILVAYVLLKHKAVNKKGE